MSFSHLVDRFAPTLAIDVGSYSTLLFQRGRGVVVNEPSLAAVSKDPNSGERSILAVGTQANDLFSKASANEDGKIAHKGVRVGGIEVAKPFQHGVVSDRFLGIELFKDFFRRAASSWFTLSPRVVAGVPAGSSDVERAELRESLHSAGARSVVLVDSAIAAALGAGVPLNQARGSLILDIGSSHARISALSMHGVVYAGAQRLGGDALDQAISQMVRREYGLIIGDKTAERIKRTIAVALPEFEDEGVEIRGYDILQSEIRKAIIVDRDVYEALQQPLSRVVTMVKSALEKMPAELAGDICEHGIMLTGGGSLVKGLDKLISREVRLPVKLVSDPISVTVRGTGSLLDTPSLLRELAIN